MSNSLTEVMTIGHSNHTFREFATLLQTHGVGAVADVRSTPYSRYQPLFNKQVLREALRQVGVSYVFLGMELGARSRNHAHYDNGRVKYSRLAAAPEFESGIERVIEGAASYRVALMCAEKDPLDCHRTLLISPALEHLRVSVTHILGDGSLESNREAMLRLVDTLGMPRVDLFRAEEEILQEAARMQEAKIAFVDRNLVGADTARQ